MRNALCLEALGTFFLCLAAAAVGEPMAVAAAEKLNYTNIMMPIGVAELILGIVAVLGYWDFMPDTAVVTAVFGIAFLMAGAVMFHLKAKDVKGALIPLVIFVVAVFGLTIR